MNHFELTKILCKIYTQQCKYPQQCISIKIEVSVGEGAVWQFLDQEISSGEIACNFQQFENGQRWIIDVTQTPDIHLPTGENSDADGDVSDCDDDGNNVSNVNC